MALSAGYLGTQLLPGADSGALPARMAGAMVAGIGLFLCLEELEGRLLMPILTG
jgi:hypothetical protein